LEVAAVWPVAAVVHRVQDPHVHRLEAVTHVWQRAPDDDRHRIVDVAALHLDLEVDWLQPTALAVRPAGRCFRRVYAHADLSSNVTAGSARHLLLTKQRSPFLVAHRGAAVAAPPATRS